MAVKRVFLFLTPIIIISLAIIPIPSLTPPRLLSPNSSANNKPSPSPIPTPTTPSPPVTIGLVGDLGLGRHITSTARSKNDFSWSFSGVSPWLTQNDFNIANLESPITDPCPEGKTGTFTFCGDRRFLPQLKDNKFILTLANNHIFNYGEKGFTQTLDFLADFQIPHYYSHFTRRSLDVGGRPDTEFITQTVNGITFGFLGYDYITNPGYDSQLIVEAVKKYNSQVDWLVVSLHWGNEYLPQAETWRIDLAHRLVDAGADIIHGHHPHVIQPSEVYQGKPVFYSLGNFIFDQSWSYETSHSQMVRLQLSKTELLATETVPITIKNNSRPEIDSASP